MISDDELAEWQAEVEHVAGAVADSARDFIYQAALKSFAKDLLTPRIFNPMTAYGMKFADDGTGWHHITMLNALSIST